ncbi:hypothetical protein PPYR_12588 [Photinus pyralis]|uniref:Uncharacterized protein n=1 Tax=Photinus pyralis TaxID=7054 RepID=A0A5N4A6T3_PHOPY|nr:hypothetical protein PPYR_12588 [Photinus pyralis]
MVVNVAVTITPQNRINKRESVEYSEDNLCNMLPKHRLAIMLCTTLVRSKQSTQLVRKTPSCRRGIDPSLSNKKNPMSSCSKDMRSNSIDKRSHRMCRHSEWKSKAYLQNHADRPNLKAPVAHNTHSGCPNGERTHFVAHRLRHPPDVAAVCTCSKK